MGETTRKITAIQALAINYGKEIEAILLKMWIKLLANYSADEVEAAVQKVILEYQYKTLPPFAVLKKALDEISNSDFESPSESDIEIMAEAEWFKLRENIRRLGRYNEPKFNITTKRVVQNLGGWWAVCNWYTDEIEWRHKDFVRLWREFYGRELFLDEGAEGVIKERKLDSKLKMLEGKFNLASNKNYNNHSKALIFDTKESNPNDQNLSLLNIK